MGILTSAYADYCRLSKFIENPLEWWNTIYLPTYAASSSSSTSTIHDSVNNHQSTSIGSFQSNVPYGSLAAIIKRHQNIKIITENIDNLHIESGISAEKVRQNISQQLKAIT